MKTLCRMQPATNDWAKELVEAIPEGAEVLIQAMPYDAPQLSVFVRIGSIDNPEVGSRLSDTTPVLWATLTRNDGHYCEVQVDIPSEKEAQANAKAD